MGQKESTNRLTNVYVSIDQIEVNNVRNVFENYGLEVSVNDIN